MATPLLEYEVVMTPAQGTEISDTIHEMVEDGWIVVSLTPTGTDIIILFMRTTPTT